MDIQYFNMIKYLDLTEVRLRYIKATFQSSKSEMVSFSSKLCKKHKILFQPERKYCLMTSVNIIKANNNLKGMLRGSCDYIASLVKIFFKIFQFSFTCTVACKITSVKQTSSQLQTFKGCNQAHFSLRFCICFVLQVINNESGYLCC